MPFSGDEAQGDGRDGEGARASQSTVRVQAASSTVENGQATAPDADAMVAATSVTPNDANVTNHTHTTTTTNASTVATPRSQQTPAAVYPTAANAAGHSCQMTVCAYSGCVESAIKRGLCQAHWIPEPEPEPEPPIPATHTPPTRPKLTAFQLANLQQYSGDPYSTVAPSKNSAGSNAGGGVGGFAGFFERPGAAAQVPACAVTPETGGGVGGFTGFVKRPGELLSAASLPVLSRSEKLAAMRAVREKRREDEERELHDALQEIDELDSSYDAQPILSIDVLTVLPDQPVHATHSPSGAENGVQTPTPVQADAMDSDLEMVFDEHGNIQLNMMGGSARDSTSTTGTTPTAIPTPTTKAANKAVPATRTFISVQSTTVSSQIEPRSTTPPLPQRPPKKPLAGEASRSVERSDGRVAGRATDVPLELPAHHDNETPPPLPPSPVLPSTLPPPPPTGDTPTENKQSELPRMRPAQPQKARPRSAMVGGGVDVRMRPARPQIARPRSAAMDSFVDQMFSSTPPPANHMVPRRVSRTFDALALPESSGTANSEEIKVPYGKDGKLGVAFVGPDEDAVRPPLPCFLYSNHIVCFEIVSLPGFLIAVCIHREILKILLTLMKLCVNNGLQALKDGVYVQQGTTTFPIIMLWFRIQIAQTIGNVAKTDKVLRTNGVDCMAGYTWQALKDGVYVHMIRPGAPAERLLEPGMRILAINSHDATHVSRPKCSQLVTSTAHGANNKCVLMSIRRDLKGYAKYEAPEVMGFSLLPTPATTTPITAAVTVTAAQADALSPRRTMNVLAQMEARLKEESSSDVGSEAPGMGLDDEPGGLPDALAGKQAKSPTKSPNAGTSGRRTTKDRLKASREAMINTRTAVRAQMASILFGGVFDRFFFNFVVVIRPRGCTRDLWFPPCRVHGTKLW